jgi:glycosyltransferase involved in cell wall biosynthesis
LSPQAPPAGARRPRVLMLVNVSWFFVSHRLPVALRAMESGFDFHVATRLLPESDGPALRAMGIGVHAMPFARGGANLAADMRSVIAIAAIYRKLRPDLVHLVTLKVIILGGLIARVLRVPGVVAAVPGLGYAFVATGPWAEVRRSAVKTLLRLALRHDRCAVIFQNPEDREYLVRAGVVDRAQTALIRGAGVDMARFIPAPASAGRVRIVLASRMLREKGIPVFVQAARALREQGLPADFLLAGDPDPDNPGSLSREQLARWHDEGHVAWLGHVSDMSELLRSTHVVCLPTHYGEGVPKVLIEAAAAGRAIVATDVPGCREIVQHEQSGLLVPPRDATALAAALRRLVEDRVLRERMGLAGRRLAEESFSTERVVAETLDLYRRLLSKGPVDGP